MAAPPRLRLCGQRAKFYERLVEGLLTFAGHRFGLDRQRPDGATEGDHQASARRQLARLGRKVPATIAEESGPKLPPELGYLWRMFHEVLAGMPASGMAPVTVTWEGLRAWSQQMRLAIEPWEARALVHLGLLRARVLSEKAEAAARRSRAAE